MILNIISLPHRLDRRQNCVNQCDSFGLKYCFWDGIVTPESPRKGISQAHKQVVVWAKKHQLPEVLIVEDDFLLTHRTSIERFMENKPFEYDLYLGGISGGEVKEENGEVLTQFSGLFFYMVHERFYDCFLEADESLHIDYYIGLPQPKVIQKLGRKPIIKCCYPMIAITTDGVSDNTGLQVSHDKFFRRYKKWRGYNP